MIALLSFNTHAGFSIRKIYVAEGLPFRVERLDGYMMLPNTTVSLPEQSSGAVAICRTDDPDLLTWVGIYRPLPRNLSSRHNDYCGVGVWLRDRIADGPEVYRFLAKQADETASEMAMSSKTTSSAAAGGLDGNTDPSLSAILQDAGFSYSPRTPVGEAGLKFAGYDAAVQISLEDYEAGADVSDAITAAQTFAGLRDFTRAFIPLDAWAEKAMRVSQKRNLESLRLSIRSTQRSDPPTAPLTTSTRQPKMVNYSEPLTIADVEEHTNRRFQSMGQRIDELERESARSRAPTMLLSLVFSIAAVVISLVLSFVLIQFLSPTAPSEQTQRMPSVSADIPKPIGPSDLSVRLEAALSEVAALISVSSANDDRRRKAITSLLEVLATSPDQDVKTAADRTKTKLPK